MSTTNIAPPKKPQTFHIHPCKGESILLHGWQRAYAQFDVQWKVDELPFLNTIDTFHVRQELFEATDHSWLLVETVTHGNVAKANELDYRQCRAFHFDDKSQVTDAPLMHRQHLHALFEACDIPYQMVIGKELSDD